MGVGRHLFARPSFSIPIKSELNMGILSTIKNGFRDLLVGHRYADELDINHLIDPNRRRFTSPRTQGYDIFRILDRNTDLQKQLDQSNNQFNLVRYAMVGQEIRALFYRAATDLIPAKGVFPVYDPNWEKDGIFHVVIEGQRAELIQNHYVIRSLVYDAYEPYAAITLPLTADEIRQFEGSWYLPKDETAVSIAA